MNASSPRFKSITVTIGISFWFFIFLNSTEMFSVKIFLIFIISLFTITQIFSKKISKGLDLFAKVNTKIFLGILFCTVISTYGVFFKLLKIDLLRLKKQKKSYWLNVEQTELNRSRKQY